MRAEEEVYELDKSEAEEEIRTLDPLLGTAMRYH